MAYKKQIFQDGQVLEAGHLNHIEDGVAEAHESISKKQDELVSGTNIKTINGQSLLGDGNIEIEGGNGALVTVDDALSETSTNPVQNKVIYSELSKKQDSLTIDSALSSTSTNPVQNKVVYSELAKKQNKLVSGESLKTINGFSLLGQGNVSVQGGDASSFSVELDGDEICDYYAINSSGEAVSATGFGCSSFIPCAGCVEMRFTNMQLTSAKSYGLAFYDANKAFISYVPSLVGSKQASIEQEVTVPEGAHYFKASFFDYETQKTVGRWKCSMVFVDENTYSREGKRVYQDGYIWFSQGVNQSVTRYWETAESVQNEGVYKATTSVLCLPKNYNHTGKKVPLILYAHGLSHYVYYGAWGAQDTFLVQKQHWLDMGFAIMDCNGARDNSKKGQFASGICPQGINAYKQSVDYIVKHYNVDPQIFIVAGSAGGAVGWNYLSMYGQDVRASVFISAYADIKADAYSAGGQSKYFVEYLGFDSSNTYEVEKTIGFDPILRIHTINDKPYCFAYNDKHIYGLYGELDTYALIGNHKKMFQALRNAGAMAQLRKIDGVGHEIVSGGNVTVDAEVGNWLLSHWGEMPGDGINVEMHTITYEYVDENGTTIKTADTLSVITGTVKDFNADKPTIEGYEFVSVSPANATVTQDITVRFTFKKVQTYTVTYEYKDGAGTTILASTSEVVNGGTVLNLAGTAPVIDGYTFASVTPETVTVTSDVTVTYLYEAVPVYTITYVYQTADGTTVRESSTEQVNGGTLKTFTGTAPSVTGYSFQSVSPESATIDGNLTVTYLYAEADEADLTSLFTWDRENWMCVTNPIFKSSTAFMSCFTDLSAYVGKTIEITVPQYTASNGGSSTGMSMWCTQPVEDTSYIKSRLKAWDTDTNGNAKGVLVPIQAVVPAEAPYLWTSTYMDGAAAYVGPNSGREDFYCRVID